MEFNQVEEEERFEIKDDSSLNWVFREILTPLYEEVKRVKGLAQAEIERIEKWEEGELRSPLQGIEYWEQRVADYHLDLLQKDPKKKTISTPYGKSKTTTSKAQPDQADKEKLLEYVKKNDLQDFLKVEESVRWEDLKKTLRVSGENVIDENGEIVEGAKVKPVTVTHKVEVN